MSAAARSVRLFGCYLFAAGVVLALAPNVLLGIVGVPTTDEPWIRLLGLVVALLASCYLVCAKAEVAVLIRATVPARVAAAAGLFVVAAVWGHWGVALFGAVDASGALWTWSALRRAKETVAPAAVT